jgi:two-component system, NtrC family, sensor kinase
MTRCLLLLVPLLINVPGFGQVFRLDSLPMEGGVVTSRYRWMAGNVPGAAAPRFDDSRWAIVPARPPADSLPGFRQQGTGWLRLTFAVSPTLSNVPVSLRVYQRGAARVYLDGQLIRQYGKIGPDGHAQRPEHALQDDYTVLPLLAAGRHTLALYIAHWPIPTYVPTNLDQAAAAVALRFAPTRQLTKYTADAIFWKTVFRYGIIGFFIALAVVHTFYYFVRQKRISLIFSLTMLLGGSYLVLDDVFRYITDTERLEWFMLLRSLGLVLYLVSLLVTYHHLLHTRLGVVFWLGTLLMLGNTFVNSYTLFPYSNILFSVGIGLMFVSGMSLSVRAVRANKADGWVTMGCMSLLITAMTVQLFVNILFPGTFVAYIDLINEITSIIFILTVPLTLALLLARESAQTNRELTRNLAEVQQLSAEKEQILTQQKALLEQQVAERTAELNQLLNDLRATQTQLVQKEKMASLGELTAGIAHEIQNPLNFVNNFTEVSTELIEELREEHEKGTEADRQLEIELIGDLAQNLAKIGVHGKRAASIVRGMLEHSRSSTGECQPTDLNALADEYLRLSYHGIRAKHSEFNAKLVTNFDTSLPPVSVVAQDIGRVLLNLFNNAFYAVQQRTRTAEPSYVPTVTVSTKQADGKAVITVADNGTGIPAQVRDKIFQPFFTTKPTGQGTGLGLSLSYDIITKGHGGTLQVRSQEGEGAAFEVVL